MSGKPSTTLMITTMRLHTPTTGHHFIALVTTIQLIVLTGMMLITESSKSEELIMHFNETRALFY